VFIHFQRDTQKLTVHFTMMEPPTSDVAVTSVGLTSRRLTTRDQKYKNRKQVTGDRAICGVAVRPTQLSHGQLKTAVAFLLLVVKPMGSQCSMS